MQRVRKWLSFQKTLNSTAVFGQIGQLQLLLASIVEEYKAGKVRTVMTLKYSKDPAIREDSPEVRTGRKWKAEEASNAVIQIWNMRKLQVKHRKQKMGSG